MRHVDTATNMEDMRGLGTQAAEDAAHANPDGINVGDRVRLSAKLSGSDTVCGVVRFFGETLFSAGPWVGVALDAPLGKNDGVVEGHRYFTCEPKHGIFLRPKM